MGDIFYIVFFIIGGAVISFDIIERIAKLSMQRKAIESKEFKLPGDRINLSTISDIYINQDGMIVMVHVDKNGNERIIYYKEVEHK